MSVIAASGLYKVFGPRPHRAVEQLENGADRQSLREQGSTAAVIDADFEVRRGEIFVVMGLSGSGKSTLIRMVNGLYDATAGDLSIDGESITGMSKEQLRRVRRDKISMVFQNFALLPHRTVGQNAAYGLEIKGLPEKQRRAKAEEALAMVGLEGWGSSYPHQLSGGMRQRVGLARALAADTEVLLMDEAFSALDPLIRRDMQDQLVELQRKLHKTILFITHDLNEAMRLGDRIAIMRDGRIVQIGTSEEILNDPANDYVSAFVQDVDRTRVLSAEAIMEQPPSVLGPSQGPKTAHRLVRENQSSWLLVLNDDRTPRGVLWEDDIARAVREESSELPWSDQYELPTVHRDVLISELFATSAENPVPHVVVDDDGRFLGVIPRVTLMSAVGSSDDGAVHHLANNTEPGTGAPWDDSSPEAVTETTTTNTTKEGGVHES